MEETFYIVLECQFGFRSRDKTQHSRDGPQTLEPGLPSTRTRCGEQWPQHGQSISLSRPIVNLQQKTGTALGWGAGVGRGVMGSQGRSFLLLSGFRGRVTGPSLRDMWLSWWPRSWSLKERQAALSAGLPVPTQTSPGLLQMTNITEDVLVPV